VQDETAYLRVPFVLRAKHVEPARLSAEAAQTVEELRQEMGHLAALQARIAAESAVSDAETVRGSIQIASAALQRSANAAVGAVDSAATHEAVAHPVPTLSGVPIQSDTYLVLLRSNATQKQIDQLLAKYHLQVVKVVADIGLLVLQGESAIPVAPGSVTSEAAPSSPSHTREVDIAALLRHEPPVAVAALNVVLGPAVVPPPSATLGVDPLSHTAASWDWREGPGSPRAGASDGNWGLVATRFPAAWNFLDAIRRRGAPTITVGIIDEGFAAHEDLRFQVSPIGTVLPSDHGNHVAGIIGATWGNQIGIDGACPICNLVVAAPPSVDVSSTPFPRMMIVLSEFIATFMRFVEATPNLEVINLSIAYNWVANYQRSPDTDEELQQMVMNHGLIVKAAADRALAKGVIIVSAAGNDSSDYQQVSARYSSPFNWAALDTANGPAAQNILIVQSVGRSGNRSTVSNVDGDVSAPGEGILSTVATRDGHPANNGYAVLDGTSMAAPLVTALVALVRAYNPQLTVAQT